MPMPPRDLPKGLSLQARDALVVSGVQDLEAPDSAQRLLAVHGTGRKALKEIAGWVEQAGSKLGGYAEARRGRSGEPTMTTVDAAQVLGIDADYYLFLAPRAWAPPKARRDGRVWSEYDIDRVRELLFRLMGPKRAPRTIAGWSSFPVQRTPDRSVLACIASAGACLGTLAANGDPVAHLEKGVRDHGSRQFAASLAKGAFREKSVLFLADLAGLHVYRPNPARVEDFVHDEGDRKVSLAFVRQTLADPSGASAPLEASTFVLVLDVLPQGVVVADPHPWNPPVRVIPADRFVASWEAARTERRWAASLYAKAGP